MIELHQDLLEEQDKPTYYLDKKLISGQTYIQDNENTCGFLAIINALSYFNKPIPNIKKLRKLAKKYQLQYGSSPQDIQTLSHELGIHLSKIKPDKNQIINAVNKEFPVLISMRFSLNAPHIPEPKYDTKIINFNVGINNIISFLSSEQNEKLKENCIGEFHTTLIIEYDKNIDKFLCLNMFHNCWMNYNEFIFDVGPNGEKWDTTFICTTTPIKITGFPL
jgi:hypothetical protein